MANPHQKVEGSIHASVDLSSSTAGQTVYAGATSTNICITSLSISTDTAQSVKLTSTGGGTVIARKFLPANSVWSKSYDIPVIVPEGSALLVVCGGSSGNVTVDLEGYTE